jgi:endonuclease/exonuclease/phosphatase family metal-dependent hydrolase
MIRLSRWRNKFLGLKTPLNIGVLLLPGIILFSSCDPFNATLSPTDVSYFSAGQVDTTPIPDTMVIMTWNIKFGGGRIDFFFDCFGDRVLMEEHEVISNLDALAEKIRQVDPEILFIQEADVQSKRSANINQVQYLLEQTALNYAVYAPQWRVSYIPEKGLGRMNSGNAILSKWKMTDAIRHGLPLFENQSAIVRYFYLRRCILTTDLILNNDTLVLLNTHLSAYSPDQTKKEQIEILLKMTDSLDRCGKTFLLCGDFNTLPPGTVKVKGFPDSVCEEGFIEDDYSAETTWMIPFYRYSESVPQDRYLEDNTSWFTHTVDNEDRGGFWNRKIDYIFTNRHFMEGIGVTHQDEKSGMKTMHLSDHCPITVKYCRK